MVCNDFLIESLAQAVYLATKKKLKVFGPKNYEPFGYRHFIDKLADLLVTLLIPDLSF